MLTLPTEFVSLEEATDAFIMGRETESKTQFYQSDVAALACVEKNRDAWGLTDEDILKHIGNKSDTSRTTMYGRLLVGKVFSRPWREKNQWCEHKYWSHFELCARTYSEATPDLPYEWLEHCVENDLSVRDLRAEMVLAKGGSPGGHAIYLCKAKWATVEDIGIDHLAVTLDEWLDDPLQVQTGDRVVITVVKEPEEIPVPA